MSENNKETSIHLANNINGNIIVDEENIDVRGNEWNLTKNVLEKLVNNSLEREEKVDSMEL